VCCSPLPYEGGVYVASSLLSSYLAAHLHTHYGAMWVIRVTKKSWGPSGP
jgi:hypothetical protein